MAPGKCLKCATISELECTGGKDLVFDVGEPLHENLSTQIQSNFRSNQLQLESQEDSKGEMESMGELRVTVRGGRKKIITFSPTMTPFTIALFLCHWTTSACHSTRKRSTFRAVKP
jgi:hypothetical protein